jgi:hypothetical protein
VRPSPHLPKPRAENPAPCVSLPYRGFTAASDVGGHHTPPADPPEASHALRVFTGTEPAGAKSYPAPPPRRTRPTELRVSTDFVFAKIQRSERRQSAQGGSLGLKR